MSVIYVSAFYHICLMSIENEKAFGHQHMNVPGQGNVASGYFTVKRLHKITL